MRIYDWKILKIWNGPFSKLQGIYYENVRNRFRSKLFRLSLDIPRWVIMIVRLFPSWSESFRSQQFLKQRICAFKTENLFLQKNCVYRTELRNPLSPSIPYSTKLLKMFIEHFKNVRIFLEHSNTHSINVVYYLECDRFPEYLLTLTINILVCGTERYFFSRFVHFVQKGIK